MHEACSGTTSHLCLEICIGGPTPIYSLVGGKALHVHHTRFSSFVVCDLLCLHLFPSICVSCSNLGLEFNGRFRRIQPLWAAIRAIHDTVATVKLHSVVDPCKTLLGVL